MANGPWVWYWVVGVRRVGELEQRFALASLEQDTLALAA
jgi:hypothetical protein